jgi:hypothetical protein
MKHDAANSQKQPIRTGRFRKCYWFAEPEIVESDASSKAGLYQETEECIEVNLSGLPQAKRKPVWDWIQANRPELAKMLSEDPNLLALKAAFGYTVKVELPTSVCRDLGLIR